MARCFVIQPFDKAKFDKRFKDIFDPAIRNARLEPYRVDRDAASIIPIDEIEAGIKSCEACFADITTNNPNVWFEVGYAIASGKLIVLASSTERNEPFPFDIRHRSVLSYSVDSSSDFDSLGAEITKKLIALLERKQEIQSITSMSPLQETEGLSPHEITVLVIVLSESLGGDGPSPYDIKKQMEEAGFTSAATAITLSSLTRKDLVSKVEGRDYEGNPYIAYALTPKGEDWMLANQEKIKMRTDQKVESNPFKTDDDLPF